MLGDEYPKARLLGTAASLSLYVLIQAPESASGQVAGEEANITLLALENINIQHVVPSATAKPKIWVCPAIVKHDASTYPPLPDPPTRAGRYTPARCARAITT